MMAITYVMTQTPYNSGGLPFVSESRSSLHMNAH